jgi:hypothetical protein
MSKKSENARVMLPLDTPRVVTLKGKHTSYSWNLRRVLAADWLKFFTSIVSQTLQIDGQREQVVESDSALVALVDSVVTSVEGYGDLSVVKDWKSALPVNHRVAIGLVLRSVAEEKRSADASVLCDLVDVNLSATWPTDGKSFIYAGLVHRFRHPGIEDLKRFNFEASRVRVSGTAENGISVYPSRQAIAMKIYDDLIESVDGYSIGGQPLEGIEAIKREMDGAHKAAAALALFAGAEEVAIQ